MRLITLVAKFLKEKGLDVSVRDTYISVKWQGIRQNFNVDSRQARICVNVAIDVHSPTSFEDIYNAIRYCTRGGTCEACDLFIEKFPSEYAKWMKTVRGTLFT